MDLKRCKKEYVDGTHRIKSPQETYSAISAKMPDVSIDTVEDITNKDRIGIPVFLSIGHDKSGMSVTFKGKGASSIEAKVSAMMEAIERYSSSFNEELVLVAPESSLDHDFISPTDLVLPNPMMYNASMSIGWTLATDIVSSKKVYVPSNAVFHPFPQNYGWLFRSNTNGLATGNCIEEAILHALCEVIERDAWSLAELTTSPLPDLEYDGSNKIARMLYDKFNCAEVDISVKDITSDIGVPTFVAAADDTKLNDPTLLTVGVGSHLNPDIALIRALTEVAQSRLTQIYENEKNPNGAVLKRRLGYEKIKRMNARWYSPTHNTYFSDIKDNDTSYIMDDIEVLLNQLKKKGMSNALIVDLSNEAVGIPAVRAIVPGLEQCSVDRDRIGLRAREYIKKR